MAPYSFTCNEKRNYDNTAETCIHVLRVQLYIGDIIHSEDYSMATSCRWYIVRNNPIYFSEPFFLVLISSIWTDTDTLT